MICKTGVEKRKKCKVYCYVVDNVGWCLRLAAVIKYLRKQLKGKDFGPSGLEDVVAE